MIYIVFMALLFQEGMYNKMKSLDGLTSGKYKVTTAHKTYYIVDLDNSTFMRVKLKIEIL